MTSPIPIRVYQLYLGDYVREGRAIAIWESGGENIYALSPGALSAGLMQQSRAWQAQYAPTLPPVTAIIATNLYHWAMLGGPLHPYFQLACYATFCAKHADMIIDERLRLYHYGHPQMSDPDLYVKDVMDVYIRLKEDGEYATAA